MRGSVGEGGKWGGEGVGGEEGENVAMCRERLTASLQGRERGRSIHPDTFTLFELICTVQLMQNSNSSKKFQKSEYLVLK